VPGGSAFGFDPDPDNPGWHIWGPREDAHFNALYDPVRVQPEGPGRSRVRCVPQQLLTSVNGNVHGGALLGFIDISLFAGVHAMGHENAGRGLTLDLSTQFIGPARWNVALDAVVELSRETGRLMFLRGMVEQEGAPVASFLGTIRKVS